VFLRARRFALGLALAASAVCLICAPSALARGGGGSSGFGGEEGEAWAEAASVNTGPEGTFAVFILIGGGGGLLFLFLTAVLIVGGRAVAAWAEAIDGDRGELGEFASPQALRDLLHPGDPAEQTRLVVRGPDGRELRILALDAQPSDEPARLFAVAQAAPRGGGAGARRSWAAVGRVVDPNLRRTPRNRRQTRSHAHRTRGRHGVRRVACRQSNRIHLCGGSGAAKS